MTIFKTERLIVRQYSMDDAGYFFLLNGDEAVTRYIRPAKTREECDAFLHENIQYYEANPQYGRWAVDDKITGEFVGSFAIIPVPGKEQMQLGYSLLPAHWGKGYATELSKAGLEYVFSRTTIDPIYAYTAAPHIASQQVLLKAGFNYIGDTIEGENELSGFILSKEAYALIV
jgi:ribosomal-protein-alanine N-acetyltransferase